MILYHGSNVEVKEPKLLYSRKSLDFGAGFYTTSDLEQAHSWARRIARVRKQGTGLVNVYETTEAWDTLAMLRFESANREWLDFVTANTQKLKDQFVLKSEKAVSAIYLKEVLSL